MTTLWYYYLYMHQNENLIPGTDRPTSLHPEQPEIPPHGPALDDLYGVGPDKPVGYLPVMRIADGGENPYKVDELSKERGLSTFWYYPPDAKHDWDARLYVYDPLALEHLLGQNTNTLQRYGWPATATEFVERVSAEHVHPKRQANLYRLIARTFNDAANARSRLERARDRATQLLGGLTSDMFKK